MRVKTAIGRYLNTFGAEEVWVNKNGQLMIKMMSGDITELVVDFEKFTDAEDQAEQISAQWNLDLGVSGYDER